MNVSLTGELERFIHEKVKSGLYNSASEVIRESLRILKEQEALRKARLEQLRKDIMVGIRQADRGESVEFNLKEFLTEAHRQFPDKGRKK